MDIEMEAESRGRERALAEMNEGCTGAGSRLSPELDGELIARLLGDLIARYVEAGENKADAIKWVCHDFVRGYLDEWEG